MINELATSAPYNSYFTITMILLLLPLLLLLLQYIVVLSSIYCGSILEIGMYCSILQYMRAVYCDSIYCLARVTMYCIAIYGIRFPNPGFVRLFAT